MLTLSDTTNILMIALYEPIRITSLIENVLVLLVIVSNRRMRSETSNFLINLAAANLLGKLFGLNYEYQNLPGFGYSNTSFQSFLSLLSQLI